MTLIIVAILLVSFVLIATEQLTNINKAAVAMFAGTLGWVLYICYGTDFVMREHQGDYVDFLNGAVATSTAVKHYIAQNIFLKYVGTAAELVLFLLATMTIVEILNNNGCFDFLTPMVRTRKSRRMLWSVSALTFFISANLDNLTTTALMLVVVHNLLSGRRLRIIYGSAVVVAANAGGALTVIGDPTGVFLWNTGAVTASNFMGNPHMAPRQVAARKGGHRVETAAVSGRRHQPQRVAEDVDAVRGNRWTVVHSHLP